MAVQLAWGMKRACQSCGEHFYDLRKSPIVCPGCGTNYQMPHLNTRGKKRADDKDSNKAFDDIEIPEDLMALDPDLMDDATGIDEQDLDGLTDDIESHEDE